MSATCMVALAATLCGCAGSAQVDAPNDDNKQAIEIVSPAEPEVTPEPETVAEPTEPEEQPSEDTAAGRQDGERFEATIMLEGTEEKVMYEHARDLAIGFEIDFEYESLTRQKGSDAERFISVYDDPSEPVNYLEISYTDKPVDDVISSAASELSKDYETVTEEGALATAGSCTKIITTVAKSKAVSDRLQTVYVIPAGDGSIVAITHYTLESAEGFGSRFAQMLDTLEVIGRTAEASISEEQALEAVRNYCIEANPDLEAMSASDDYTLYWDVSRNEAGQIVVLYRSYTGAQIRYYVDPDSGDTYVTELVPGITDEETRTDEVFNVRDHLGQ